LEEAKRNKDIKDSTKTNGAIIENWAHDYIPVSIPGTNVPLTIGTNATPGWKFGRTVAESSIDTLDRAGILAPLETTGSREDYGRLVIPV